MTPSLPIGLVMTYLYLLIVAALRAGEGPDIPGAVGGDDGGLVPVKDVAALLALLAKGHNRAPLVDDQAARHLYRHVSRPSEGLLLDHRDTEAIVPETHPLPTARKHLSIRSID